MDFSALRLMSLFQPQRGIQDKNLFRMPPAVPINDPLQQQVSQPMAQPLNDYQPRTSAQQMFEAALQQMPQRTNPNMITKIAAALSDFGGDPRVGDDIMYGGYNRKVADWKTRVVPLQQAADNENQYNTNQRILSNDRESRQLQARGIERQETADRTRDENTDLARKETERKNLSAEEDRKRRTDIAEKRADVYALKSEKPNTKFIHDSASGKIFAVDANDPSAQPIDTGLTHGDLSDLDKIRLGLQNRLTEIGATQDRVDARAATTQQAITDRTEKNIKPPTPTADNRALLNKAQQLYNSRPDLQPYLALGNDGKPNAQIKAASGPFLGMGGGDKNKEQEARDLLYGKTTIDKNVLSPIEKRVIGQEYTMPDGHKAKWTGKGFEG